MQQFLSFSATPRWRIEKNRFLSLCVFVVVVAVEVKSAHTILNWIVMIIEWRKAQWKNTQNDGREHRSSPSTIIIFKWDREKESLESFFSLVVFLITCTRTGLSSCFTLFTHSLTTLVVASVYLSSLSLSHSISSFSVWLLW